MTFAPDQFLSMVVEPTLQLLDAKAAVPYTEVARNLVMGTIAQESLLGTYLVQQGGPALGVCQIQTATLTWLLGRLSAPEAAALASISTSESPAENVVSNLAYAVAVCRLYYWVSPTPLPPNTVAGLFSVYKSVWNTPAGAATLEEFAEHWALTGISLP